MKLGYRPDEAAHVLGSSEILQRMRAAGWLNPIIQSRKLVLFDGADLARAWARLQRKEVLPPITRNKTSD